MKHRLPPLAARLALAVLAVVASAPAMAWNAGGHRLVAAIAWRGLDDDARQAVGTLLARHPDHAAWLARNTRAEPAYAAFLEASTWPDDIRRDARFAEGEGTGARIAGFPEMTHHRRWHYIDQPVFATPIPRPRPLDQDGELRLRFGQFAALVADRSAGAEARAHALTWLVHLVGDAHQPLHTVSRYDANGESDDGGNALWIDNPFHPRRREMTLHAYWDDLPAPPWLRGSRLEGAAERLIRENRPARAVGTVGEWLAEGKLLATTTVYDGLHGDVPTIEADYNERALRVARERVTLAGQRLGLLLNGLLGGHPVFHVKPGSE